MSTKLVTFNEKEVAKIRELFDEVDADHSGSISMKELKVVFEKHGVKLSDSQVANLIKKVDVNNSSEIEFSEFISLCHLAFKAPFGDFCVLEEGDIEFEKLKLHAYAYIDPEPKGIVFFSHGLSEHTLRHTPYISVFASNGFSVFALDLPDHGKSAIKQDEPFALIHSLPDTLNSWVTYIESVASKPEFQSLPKFYVGHSLGATIGILVCRRVKKYLSGVVLSAPTIFLDASGTTIFFLKLISKMWDTACVSASDLSKLTHDPKVIKETEDDQFFVKTGTPARTGQQIHTGTLEIQAHFDEDDYPVLVMHGEKDEVASIKNSELYMEKSPSKDKTLKVFPGMFHEIHNESCREEVHECALSWISNHLTTPLYPLSLPPPLALLVQPKTAVASSSSSSASASTSGSSILLSDTRATGTDTAVSAPSPQGKSPVCGEGEKEKGKGRGGKIMEWISTHLIPSSYFSSSTATATATAEQLEDIPPKSKSPQDVIMEWVDTLAHPSSLVSPSLSSSDGATATIPASACDSPSE